MLLQVDDLRAQFEPRRAPAVMAVRGVSFSIDRGEILGLVGESGSGKSVTALSLVGLLDPPGRIAGGSIRFDGVDLAALPERSLRDLRGKRIAFIFQDPMTALNPVLTVGTQISETLAAHEKIGRAQAWRDATGWLDRVRIPDAARRMNQYPHELSGGMRQRVMIAMAFCLRPELLIADEPTTALDVTVQRQILDLMDDMRAEVGTAVLLITHDLGIVAERCSRVAVMYGGEIVETAPVEDLFATPRHPYTKALLASLPALDAQLPDGPAGFLAGRPPSLRSDSLPTGCSFAPRCSAALSVCRERPAPVVGAPDRMVRCHLYGAPGSASAPATAAGSEDS